MNFRLLYANVALVLSGSASSARISECVNGSLSPFNVKYQRRFCSTMLIQSKVMERFEIAEQSVLYSDRTKFPEDGVKVVYNVSERVWSPYDSCQSVLGWKCTCWATCGGDGYFRYRRVKYNAPPSQHFGCSTSHAAYKKKSVHIFRLCIYT